VPRDANALADVVIEVIRDALRPLRDQMAALETEARAIETRLTQALSVTETRLVHDAALTLTKELGAVRERLVVVETRAPVPGPPGTNGVDGQDGLGFDDVGVDFDGNRTITVRFQRGDQVKTFPIELPYLKWQGTYRGTSLYHPGDVVTWAGMAWHANEPTTDAPGERSKAWTLMVKRGRDGKDARS
jgi:hypothetical protein